MTFFLDKLASESSLPNFVALFNEGLGQLRRFGPRSFAQFVQSVNLFSRPTREPSNYSPIDIFDPDYYSFQCKSRGIDLGEHGATKELAFQHFCEVGFKLRIDPCEYIDIDWYWERYKDVSDVEGNPLLHYFVYGAEEARDPSESFSTFCYLYMYADVKRAGVNPLAHFMKYGIGENRIAMNVHFLPDIREYRSQTREYAIKGDPSLSLRSLMAYADGNLDTYIRIWLAAGPLGAGYGQSERKLARRKLLELLPRKPVAPQAEANNIGEIENFRPSAEVIAFVKSGIVQYTAYLGVANREVGNLDSGERAIILPEDHSNFFEIEKNEEEINKIDKKLSLEIADIILMKIYDVANRAKISEEKRAILSDKSSFNLDILSYLDGRLPLHPSDRSVAYQLLHDDLYMFVMKYSNVSGPWRALHVRGGVITMELSAI